MNAIRPIFLLYTQPSLPKPPYRGSIHILHNRVLCIGHVKWMDMDLEQASLKLASVGQSIQCLQQSHIWVCFVQFMNIMFGRGYNTMHLALFVCITNVDISISNYRYNGYRRQIIEWY